MEVFSSKEDTRSIDVWGPTVGVTVEIQPLSDILDDTWMLYNLSVGAREITDIRQCFNDVSFIYALGNNQTNCSMTLEFMVFVGRKSCKGDDHTNAIGDGLDAYTNYRISAHTDPTQITIGSFSRWGWITGIDIGGVDPKRGICRGRIYLNIQLQKV